MSTNPSAVTSIDASEGVKVSYCTTCHGRLWQLALTLFDNLGRLREDEEMIILDYGSPDGLGRFVESSQRCRDAINQGKLVYAFVEAGNYHCPKAKNLAHRLGRGTWLVNLDADNSNEGMRELIDAHLSDPRDRRVLHMDDPVNKGAYGRICMSQYWFYRLGGYDETFLPSAYQDTDLLKRAKAMGFRRIMAPTGGPAPLKNTLHEKSVHTGINDWSAMGRANKAVSEMNLHQGRLVANPGGWGAAAIQINFHPPMRLEAITPPIISLVLRSRKPLAKVNRLLELYNQMPFIGEIFLINHNPRFAIEKIDGSGPKITVTNVSSDFGSFARFGVASLASYPAVLLADDDLFLPEETLAELHRAWSADPSILHGVTGRNTSRAGYSDRKVYGPCEIVPTRGVMTTVADCVRSITYASRLKSELGEAPMKDGEDILLSFVVGQASGRPNMAHRLPVEELRPAKSAGPGRVRERPRHRSAVVQWCRENISKRSSSRLNIVVHESLEAAPVRSRPVSRSSRREVLYAGPWVGEFGWELCWWNPLIRSLAEGYRRVVVAAPEGSRYLYEFADEFIPLRTEGWRFAEGRLLEGTPRAVADCDILSPSALWEEYGVPEFEALGRGDPILTPKNWRVLAPAAPGPVVADVLCAFRPRKLVGNRLVEGKEYSPEQSAELVRRLLDAGLTVACYGGADNHWFEGTVDLRGMSLESQCSALGSARCAIGPSSGTIHLASLCRCPHVTWSGISGDIAVRYETLWNPFSVPASFLNSRSPSPDEIFSAAIAIIESADDPAVNLSSVRVQAGLAAS